VLGATNRVPERAVVDGKLREDLLYRLNVFPIRLPPLRERREDIGLLADHFLAEICKEEGQEKRLSKSAYQRMNEYDWPGNVRELRNVVQRAYVMASDSTISDEWLELQAGRSALGDAPSILSVPIGTTLAEMERSLILATLEHFEGNKERTAAALGVSLKTLYNRLKDYGGEGAQPSKERRAA
jgi:DNA-binding NtrC family response regulator